MHDFFESLFGARSAPSSGTDLQASLTVSLEDAYHGVTKELSIPAVDGSTDKPKIIRVKIPSGVRSGQQLRMKGLGLASHPRGVTGDLLLSIHVNPHAVFDLMGDDVYVTLPITPWEAALGARIMVPTLDGEVALTIPSASQGGQRLRLKKRGWPATVKGDQYIVLKMVTPVPKTDRDRELYQTMASTMPFNPRAKLGDSDNG
jgi:curved DNA-binding protein